MSTCDIGELLAAAKCFETLMPGQKVSVELQLLCEIWSEFTAPDLYQSAAAEASVVVKGSAGRLFTVGMYNNNVATRYLQGFQAAALPANGTVPVFSIPVGAGASVFQLFGDRGLSFGTGIVLANSSTALTLTVGAADSLFTASYR
jgi:hypothetical protein